jgi:hypothetical protein
MELSLPSGLVTLERFDFWPFIPELAATLRMT